MSASTALTTAKRLLPTPSRILQLRSLQSTLFETSFNPTSVRTGAKYLRARLRGPSMLNYYPRQVSFSGVNGVLRQMRNEGLAFPDDNFELEDPSEVQRLDDILALKARGKGKPKKARTKEEGRRQQKKAGKRK